MSLKRYIKKKLRTRVQRIVAMYLAISLMFDAFYPTAALALTGGPSQPEVQSFEPVGTSDMVDLFSGDFNYNIPLMDVGGYPINIGYHSGVTMDQEASWVGLGWNINPGVINRSMRGIPDDFNGDVIEKEFNMKPNRTYGLNTGAGIELFGSDKLKLGINYSIGVHYNNYNGIGIEKSLNLSLSAGDKGKSPLSGGLGITSSSDDGLTLQPSLNFSAKIAKSNNTTTSLSTSIGTAFNSRSGLKNLTIGVSANVQAQTSDKTTLKYREKVNGKNVTKTKTIDKATSASYSKGASASFDFGMPSYTPNVTLPMQNLSVTGSFKLGFELYGTHPNFTIGGYYSSQKMAQSTISNPAYGYMNADEGEKYDNAIMDFNREKDGSFNQHTPALPVSNFTYDIYSVSGQGAGGSYRPFRSDLGHVFDAASYTTSDGYSIGAEVGIGNLFHVGVDFNVNDVNTVSGRWTNDNPAASQLTHRSSTGDPLYEPYYFKEANEKTVDNDPNFFQSAGGSDAKSVYLNQLSKFHTIGDHYYTEGGSIPTDNYRKKRESRNQNISIVKRNELQNFGVDPNYISQLYNAPGHHTAEITSLGTDGSRYVYGIAAYNKKQYEVSFATGTTIDGSAGRTADANSGLVNYNSGDNSTGNVIGLDNYYSNTKMPAFSHSYLLTSVLSADFVDSDNQPGPSDGDLGNYTKFNYTKIDNYKWRIPVEKNKATHNEGLKSLKYDDKGNYLYGEKELWYLQSVETKNYIAIFKLEPRKDALGVLDEDGGVDSNPSNASKLLRKISLYSKPDYLANGANATPIKEVHFEYDYSLCPNVSNNSGASEIVDGTNINANKGKLTLKKIYFTYQNSNKARLSPYSFNYSTKNPSYNLKGYDRWGNYKPNTTTGFDALSDDMATAEYPYVEQDKAAADQNIQAWTMTSVDLPSGGKIKVSYETDDYAYVQNKKAMQMFKVVNIEESTGAFSTPSTSTSYTSRNLNFTNGTRLIVKLQDPITTGSPAQRDNTFRSKYLNNIGYLYFRFLMAIKPGKYEFVSGYLQNKDIRFNDCHVDPSGQYGCISIINTTINDGGSTMVCPITKAAVQYGRLNMSKEVWDNNDISIGDNATFGKQLLEALINSSFVKNISDAIDGPNKALYEKYYVGQEGVMNKSWVRLFNPNDRKLGGGIRVKKIEMSDEWSGMTNSKEETFGYGQEYTYTNVDGTSSGVASYEPQLGGDENPWKTPVFFEEKHLLAPDDEQYMEEPFGEMFFPSPNIGYSRVVVKNIQRKNVHKHATGYVEHEFYTAKDFPTITERTSLNAKREKNSPLSINSLLKIDVKDYMTASQGFVIELNDMHGKPKSESVYQEGQTTPITRMEYAYKKTPYLNGSFRLDNSSTVIYDNGNVGTSDIGVFFDFVSDMREHKTTTNSASINANVDGFIIPPIPAPIPIPIILPSFAREKTRFRSAVITKVIQRFGILEETTAKDLGSVVKTKNLAYDAETGETLLTQTTTDFNDPTYSLTYPAHWYYDGMGPAYRNIGVRLYNLNFTSGTAGVSNALKYFVEGDELALSDGNKAWVTQVTAGNISAVYKNGLPVTGSIHTKVIRSGRRNQQSAPMATLVSLSNPLTSIPSNIYDNIIQASAIEYTNTWRTYCDCFNSTSDVYTTNPFILGIKGFWKTKRSFLHLTNRTQTNYNNNTNVRKDGVFGSYLPYYKLVGGKWVIDGQDWTFTSEVTEFSPFGEELENRDALGRYSSAVFGYNQSLPLAVSANSRYKDMAADNFEDYDFSKCADNHFKFSNFKNKVVKTEAHTGKSSIKVGSNDNVSLKKQLVYCDLQDCDLSVNIGATTRGGQTVVSISGGIAPYSIDWTTINGSPVISLDNSGTQLIVSGSGNFEIEISAKDSKGCKQIKTFKK